MNSPATSIPPIRQMLKHLLDSNFAAATDNLNQVVKDKINARYRATAANIANTNNK